MSTNEYAPAYIYTLGVTFAFHGYRIVSMGNDPTRTDPRLRWHS